MEDIRPATISGKGLTSLTQGRGMSTSRRCCIKLLGRGEARRPTRDQYTSPARCALALDIAPRLCCDARTVFAQCLRPARRRSRHAKLAISRLSFGHVVLRARHPWHRCTHRAVLDGTDPAPGHRAVQPRRQLVPGLPQC